MPTTLFENYQNIADRAKNSHRIILVGGKGKDKTPKALSLWGRFVQACKDFFKGRESLKANNVAVLNDFKEALKEKFSSRATIEADKKLDYIQFHLKNLKARDVRTIIDIASNEANLLKISDENAEAERKAIVDAAWIEEKKEEIAAPLSEIDRTKEITAQLDAKLKERTAQLLEKKMERDNQLEKDSTQELIYQQEENDKTQGKFDKPEKETIKTIKTINDQPGKNNVQKRDDHLEEEETQIRTAQREKEITEKAIKLQAAVGARDARLEEERKNSAAQLQVLIRGKNAQWEEKQKARNTQWEEKLMARNAQWEEKQMARNAQWEEKQMARAVQWEEKLMARAVQQENDTSAVQPDENFGHQKTDKNDYSQYSFDKTFEPKSQSVPAHLMIIESRFENSFIEDDFLKNLENNANRLMLEENKTKDDASSFLKEIDVYFENIPSAVARNNFIAVYNSILDAAIRIEHEDYYINGPAGIIQQNQKLIKAMEQDSSLASKILDHFDKSTEIIQNMYDYALNEDDSSFVAQFMHLICAHNGFAKINGLDKICDFDQMFPVSGCVGFSRLLEKFNSENLSLKIFFRAIILSVHAVMGVLKPAHENHYIKEGIIANENVYNAYQHIPNHLTRNEYSRCPPNCLDLNRLCHKFIKQYFVFPATSGNAPQPKRFLDDQDQINAINEGISIYMKSELDIILKKEVQTPD